MNFLTIISLLVLITQVLCVDHYAVLGVEKDSSQTHLRKAYRKLSLKYHPDKNPGDEAAAAKFAEVNNAFEILGDEDKRLVYDEHGGTEYINRWQFLQAQKGKDPAAAKDFYLGFDLIENINSQGAFKRLIKNEIALVEFYAPWCVHCQQMTGNFKKAAVLLEEEHVKFGAVNCEKNKAICQQNRVFAYPTILIFSKGESDPYSGSHEAEAFYTGVKQWKNSEVVKLNPGNFDELIQNTEDMWIVDFSAGAWCGPCTGLKPTLRSFAAAVSGSVKVGIVECDQFGDFCAAQKGVNYYPFIGVYPKGKKRPDGKPTELQYHNDKMPSMNILETVRIIAVATGVKQGKLEAVGEEASSDDEDDFDKSQEAAKEAIASEMEKEAQEERKEKKMDGDDKPGMSYWDRHEEL